MSSTPKKKGGPRLRKNLLDFAIHCLERGLKNATIVRLVAEKGQITERQGRDYVAAGYKLLAELHPAKPVDIARIHAQFQDIAEQAERAGDLKVRLAATRELAKVVGAYAPERVQYEGQVDHDIVSLSPEDRRNRIAELLEKANKREEGK